MPRQIEEEIALYREEFPLILTDLADFPPERPVIAEGAALLPDLLGGLGLHPRHAIWIVPIEAFQLAHYSPRAWRHDVLVACTDPEQAWRNWMARDAGFARAVAAQARNGDNYLLTVDGTQSINESERVVAAWFRLRPGAPDRIRTIGAR